MKYIFIFNIEETEVLKVVGEDLKDSGGKRLIIGTNIDYLEIAPPWIDETKYKMDL